MAGQGCPLCEGDGGEVLWRDELCRVIRVDDPAYPGFCRVILNAHIPEMTDLAPAQRQRLMEVVWAVEAAVRQVCAPDKINLASLGNMVPHLHWHVIPRWRDDPCFPDAIWAAPKRPAPDRPLPDDLSERLRAALENTLAASLDRP